MLFKESDLLASIGIEPEPAPGGHVTTIDTSPQISPGATRTVIT